MYTVYRISVWLYRIALPIHWQQGTFSSVFFCPLNTIYMSNWITTSCICGSVVQKYITIISMILNHYLIWLITWNVDSSIFSSVSRKAPSLLFTSHSLNSVDLCHIRQMDLLQAVDSYKKLTSLKHWYPSMSLGHHQIWLKKLRSVFLHSTRISGFEHCSIWLMMMVITVSWASCPLKVLTD